MQVRTLCQRHVVTIDASQPLLQAALLMREHHVGSLVVTETGAADADAAHVRGVITDRDLAIEVLARGGDASRVLAGSLAGGPVVGVAEQAPAELAVSLMQTHGVRRLLVHDDDGLLAGLLSFDDLLPALVAPLSDLADVLRRGIERESHRRGALGTLQRPPLRIPPLGTAGWSAD